MSIDSEKAFMMEKKKNSWKTRSRQDLPHPDKEHLQKSTTNTKQSVSQY